MKKWRFLSLVLLVFLLVSSCELFNSFLPKTLAPAMTPAGGTYNSDQTVTLASDTPDAVIRYTTDGTTPGSDASVYKDPIAVAGDGTTVTIKAIAKAEGMQNSDLAEATYIIDYFSVPSPTFGIAGGSFSADQDVDLHVGANSPAGTQIHYTTNGQPPTISSALYSGPIPVHGNGTTVTIKAIGVATGYTDSPVVSADYAITYPALPALGSTAAGGISSPGSFTAVLTSSVSGATISYTLDGSNPLTSGTAVSGVTPVTTTTINNNPPTLLRAVATAPGYSASPERVEAFSSIPMITIPGYTTIPQFQNQAGFFRVTTAYYISKFEITQAQYIAVLTEENGGVAPTNPSYHKFEANWPNCPVENITWYDAVEFCNKLNHYLNLHGLGGSGTPAYTITGRTPATGYPITSATVTLSGNPGIRLPTEMEWELAARYGNPDTVNKYNALTGYPWGAASGDAPTYAWLNATYTTVVGSKTPTAGICDLEGNVSEWIGDWLGALPTDGINGAPHADYTGPASGSFKVIRGSNFASSTPDGYVNRGNARTPASHELYFGIRVVYH
jgi:hypothetical protein